MKKLPVDAFLQLATAIPLIDVRSPAEFSQGHIDGAQNLPLLDNGQRAEVGTLYKQSGRIPALLRGLEIVGLKMKHLAERGLQIAGQEPGKLGNQPKDVIGYRTDVLVYCWRGGARSNSIAWLLEQVDLNVGLLEGGYRAFRRNGQDLCSIELSLRVIGGLTGSGKTHQLKCLESLGEQVIDLEGLANHRGSAFGGVGLGNQPTVEQFENRLHDRIRKLDIRRRIWIEAESQSIGRVFIPVPFFNQAIAAPMIVMNVPLETRVDWLTREYSRFPKSELIDSVEKIRKRLGGQNVKEAIAAINREDFGRCVEICLAYYDKSYRQGDKYCQQRSVVHELNVSNPTDPTNAQRLLSWAESIDDPIAATEPKTMGNAAAVPNSG